MAVAFWRPPGDIFGPPTNISRNISSSNIIYPSRMAEKSSPDSLHDATSFSRSADDASDPPQVVETGISSGTLEVPVSSTSNSLSQGAQATPVASTSALSSASSAGGVAGALSLPSTSSGSPGEYLPALRGPPSPPLDLLADDDLSDRMEFNNNNGNAPNFMWLEENNNTALIDLNAVEPRRGQMLDELRDPSETEDMDL